MGAVRQNRKYLVANPNANAEKEQVACWPECRMKLLESFAILAKQISGKISKEPKLDKIEDWHLVVSESYRTAFTCEVQHESENDYRNDSDGLLYLDPPDGEFLVSFRKELEAASKGDGYAYFAADRAIDVGETWQNLTVAGPFDGIFGNRSQAGTLIGIDYLKQQHEHRVPDGEDVNVVIVDKGLDEEALRLAGANFGGGWTTNPKKLRPGGTSGPKAMHGSMLVRNILHAAPKARIWDCPLIQDDDQAAFLSNAHAAYRRIINDIARLRKGEGWENSSWVLVNAWGVYESRRQGLAPEEYNSNRNHQFNRLLDEAVDANIDVVFCAGNCGEFWPDVRCGAEDRGPGRSIFGANGHPRVLTVGAVRTNAVWLGYSSQGPGQKGLARKEEDETQVKLAEQKPDLCVPSHFAEDADAQSINTGTSAACGLAAGVVAALRSCKDASALPPDNLKALLRRTARQLPGLAPWDSRLGRGLLDAERAFKEILAFRL